MPSPLAQRAAALQRLLVVTLLGFASGLPLALTGQAMQAWLTTDGIDLATIGFLSLVGLPYTFKFLWAPLMDRFELPGLGRRRGWLVLTQLGLGGVLYALSTTSPSASIRAFALLAVLVAFVSASQDVVIDAYRTDLLEHRERGLGASLNVMGYRLAMILSGGIALIWTDPGQGGGWTWPEVYRFMAGLMVALAVLSALALPRLKSAPRQTTLARNDLVGFVAVLAAVAAGVLLTDRFGAAVAQALFGALLAASAMAPTLQTRWLELAVLMMGLAFTLPLAGWAARAARFETLLGGLRSYFSQRGAAAFLLFIVLYKLGDAFAGSLMTPFLLKAMAFGSAEVGVVNKLIGLWLTIAGALVGGALMLRLGLWRSLLVFGVLQMASNLGFWWLAVHGKGALPGLLIPAFDWGFVQLAQPTPVDGGLLMVVAFENISGGMGTAAFVAFLMSLCNQRFTATQYALLSAFAAVGRVWVGPLAGVLAESIGWPSFFVLSTVLAAPALLMLIWLRDSVRALEVDPTIAGIADD
ncbi:AmpG family muropeptide MFS transporter [Rubrivivax gelatinosus]|uniref:PAT family beta-lactamase induction signal transducer AmpG n=1 Tax=Rubrivivax gelatinosus TaxID=28068 RepID=A0A4R2M063_RUBGE|nr:MFS transporter [Rubrivivax gelatinosus]MBK1689881.1 MFS transporter [Rubrivivax gelatinosus]TCP00389.1 PAT family beta-lactamase induction signal transducer AmpG [Rubrivivax gelatinosus]